MYAEDFEKRSSLSTQARFNRITTMKWITIINGKIEREHKSKADAVNWAQGTHCTDERPRREGGAYVLCRTTIVNQSTWDAWQNENQA
jgi:hypothetical protein